MLKFAIDHALICVVNGLCSADGVGEVVPPLAWFGGV